MRPVKVIVVGLLAWPAVEIAAFVVVAALVGVPTALFLLILVSFAGLLVLRHFGLGATRWRAPVEYNKVAGTTVNATRMATGLSGVLLVIPGFFTGLLGILTLFPVSRRWLLAACRHLFAADRGASDPKIIDLAPNEWQPLPGPKLASQSQPED